MTARIETAQTPQLAAVMAANEAALRTNQYAATIPPPTCGSRTSSRNWRRTSEVLLEAGHDHEDGHATACVTRPTATT